MANSPSARKRIRTNARRALINKNRVSRIRTLVKKVENALASGDGEAAQVALKAAQPELQRGVTKGIVHRNTAARKISRLVRAVQGLQPQS